MRIDMWPKVHFRQTSDKLLKDACLRAMRSLQLRYAHRLSHPPPLDQQPLRCSHELVLCAAICRRRWLWRTVRCSVHPLPHLCNLHRSSGPVRGSPVSAAVPVLCSGCFDIVLPSLLRTCAAVVPIRDGNLQYDPVNYVGQQFSSGCLRCKLLPCFTCGTCTLAVMRLESAKGDQLRPGLDAVQAKHCSERVLSNTVES